MFHTIFAPPTLLRLRFAYMANRAILAASLCQGHQFRRDLRGDLCSAACGSHAVTVRNDASRHVKFFLFDSLSRVAGVGWPHSMGKFHPLNPFFNWVDRKFGGCNQRLEIHGQKWCFKQQQFQIQSNRWRNVGQLGNALWCILAIFRLASQWKILIHPYSW